MGINTIVAFPSYSDVRFVQHVETLLIAVHRNFPVCRKVWKSIIVSRESTTKEKAKASDLIQTWAHDSLQFKLTALMIDVVHVFTNSQKGLQKSNIMLPDVITLRDTAVRKFEVIIRGPITEGKEEIAIQPQSYREKITHEICEQWPLLKNIQMVETSDIGCQYSDKLRKMFIKATGLLKGILGIFIVSTPHSMDTERVVSHYNRIKSIHRQSTHQENISNRLIISLNCTGTASFDPRPAVIAQVSRSGNIRES